MTGFFNDRVALITGAAGDIGQAIGRGLALRSTRIVLVDLDRSALDRVAIADESRTLKINADVTDETSMRSAFDTAIAWGGRLDMLVNSAGIEGPIAPMTDYTVADFRRILDINVVGTFSG